MRDTHRSQKGQCLLRSALAVWQVRQYRPPSLSALSDAASANARAAGDGSFRSRLAFVGRVASFAAARLTRRMFPAH